MTLKLSNIIRKEDNETYVTLCWKTNVSGFTLLLLYMLKLRGLGKKEATA